MKKNKTIFLSLIGSAIFSFSTALLVNYNLEKNYRPGEYVKAEDAYFAEKVDEPAGLIKAEKYVVPTDNKYNSQKSRSLGSGLIGDIESVWSSYTGEGTTIAIIDDGFDYNHPEYTRSDGTSAILSTSRSYYISGNNVVYKNYASDPTCIAQNWDSTYSEWDSHGTATSTTAAAPMNNGGGVGIAPDANILALKIDFYLSLIEQAILYAISQNVDVINMSLGAYAEDFTDGFGDEQEGDYTTATLLNSVCLQAYNKGIIVVAAAGNEATYRKSYPACNTHVIGVGALGDLTTYGNADKLAPFTNYVDPSQTGEINVDILAPGFVYTAHQSGTKTNITHTYDDTLGTSFSSPIVAGAAALWKEKYPNGTPSQFLSELQSSADGIGTYTNKMIQVRDYGSKYSNAGPSNITNGRLNVANLLEINEPFVTTKQSSLNIATGETRQIALDTYNGTITYSSANTGIATVSNSGLVQGVSAGNTNITVTATKDGKTASATVAVTVNEAVTATSITFNPSSVTLNVGEIYDAEATLNVTPSNASRIFLFESFDESVATVDIDTGLVTAVGAGTTEIYAMSGYGDGEAYLSVTVKNATTYTGEINFGQATGRLKVNAATISGTDDLNNTWTVTTSGTTSFTQANEYSQIGSKNNPASTIEFVMNLSSAVNFTSVSASFGGFDGTNGSVAIKVGTTTIGSGNVPAKTDVIVSNTSTAFGSKLTISITNISRGIKAYYISYSYTGDGGGTVIPPDPPEPTLENVVATNTKTYHPGETINKNDITTILHYSDGSSKATTDFTFESHGYQFTYEDTNSGTSNKSKQFSITYDGQSYNFSVNVRRNAYVTPSGTTSTIATAQFDASNVSKNTNTPSNTAVTIGGVNFTVTTNAYIFSQSGTSYLSFAKAAGSINNTNAFDRDLTVITVTQRSGSRTDGKLTISKNGSTWINYSTSEIAKGGYRYFKYAYTGTSSSYSNIEKIEYTLSGADTPVNVANYIMQEDTNNQCLTKLDLALEKLNSMNNANKSEFMSSSSYVIATARKRLEAWARHEGKELTYSSGSFVLSGGNSNSPLFNGEKGLNSGVMLIISLLGLFSISGFYLLKRKKVD